MRQPADSVVSGAEQAYLFRHALVRDAAYALFPPLERIALHRNAIGSYELLYPLELDLHAEELLQHARAGLPDDEAMRPLEYRYLKLSADHCARAWRIDDELRYLEQLAQHPHARPAERADFMVRQVRHLIERGDLREAERIADAAIEIAAQTDATRHAAMFLRYRARYEAGQVEGGLELQQLLRVLGPAGPSEPLMQARIECGIALEREGKPDEAEAEFNVGIEIARAIGHREGEAECLFERGLLLHRAGHKEEGAADLHAALKIAHATGNKRLEVQGLNRVGIVMVETNRWKEAAEAYTAARDLAHAIGMRASATTIGNNLANLDFYFLGNLSRAEDVYRRSLEFFRERNDVHSIAHSHGMLGLMYLAAGEFTQARDCFVQVREHARLQNDRVVEAKAWMGIAQCAGDGIAFDAYREAITRLRETPSHSNLSRVWTSLSEEMLDAGFIDASAEALDIAQALEQTEAHKTTRVSAAVTRRALLLGNPGEVLARFEANVGTDQPPHTMVSQVLLYRLMFEASRGADLQPLRDRMFELAATFEANRYLAVRRALELADASLHAQGRTDLYRGLPLEALPPGLAKALRQPGKQPKLNDLLPGASELGVPLALG